MKNQIRIFYFFQSRFKRRNKFMRKFSYKTNGVGKQSDSSRRKRHSSGSSVKSSKQLIVGVHRIFFNQSVQKCGFAGISISHNRDHRHRDFHSFCSLNFPMIFNFFYFFFQIRDSIPEFSLVYFKFLFSKTGSYTGNPYLLFKRRVLAFQTGQIIIFFGKFNLKFCLSAPCPVGEYLKNNACPVSYRNPGNEFYISLLRGSKFIVENKQSDILCLAFFSYFRCLAAADKKSGIRRFSILLK